MAVSHVASRPLTDVLQDYGFLGKLEKDGTVGINLPGLNNHQLNMLEAFRAVNPYQRTIFLKRSGTGIRITVGKPLTEPTQDYVNFPTKADKNGNHGFNVQRIETGDFAKLLYLRLAVRKPMTLKRSGTGLRITVAK